MPATDFRRWLRMIEQMGVPMAKADVAVMAERTTSQRFVDLLAARDFEGLATALATDAHARLLLPYGLEEDAGRDAIVRRIASWFGSASVFDLTSSTEEAVGLRQRLSWRFSVVRDGGSREVIEQLAYLDVGPHGIERIDLLCSGFQMEPGVAAGPMQVGVSIVGAAKVVEEVVAGAKTVAFA
jgi:hypothetical protein